jgi:hypothetical protein
MSSNTTESGSNDIVSSLNDVTLEEKQEIVSENSLGTEAVTDGLEIDGETPSRQSSVNSNEGNIANIPPPILSSTMWQESDSTAFKVRSSTYNTDKVKCNSAPGLFKLIAVDFYEVPETTHNIASHPRNRVSLALQRGDPTWVFVVNIMVPGPPFLSFVVYFQGDKVYYSNFFSLY